jgi:hypothetical protein
MSPRCGSASPVTSNTITAQRKPSGLRDLPLTFANDPPLNSVPKIEPISRNPGIGIGVGIGIDIEISIDSDLDSESDPDTDPDADKQSGHVIFMRLGARHAHDGLLRK